MDQVANPIIYRLVLHGLKTGNELATAGRVEEEVAAKEVAEQGLGVGGGWCC